jgi:hypothetical protein
LCARVWRRAPPSFQNAAGAASLVTEHRRPALK